MRIRFNTYSLFRPHMEKNNPEDQTLLVWQAPLRPFKKRSPMVLRFFLALALLLSSVVFFFGDVVTILPIWAMLFLFYIFAITPPPVVENHITRFGVESTAGITMRWDLLSHYYFQERLGFTVLVLVTHGPYFGHTYLVVPDEATRSAINTILSEHLMFLKNPPITFTDRLITFFSQMVPDETTHTEPTVKETARTS